MRDWVSEGIRLKGHSTDCFFCRNGLVATPGSTFSNDKNLCEAFKCVFFSCLFPVFMPGIEKESF